MRFTEQRPNNVPTNKVTIFSPERKVPIEELRWSLLRGI
jgi:hypothetical protein